MGAKSTKEQYPAMGYVEPPDFSLFSAAAGASVSTAARRQVTADQLQTVLRERVALLPTGVTDARGTVISLASLSPTSAAAGQCASSVARLATDTKQLLSRMHPSDVTFWPAGVYVALSQLAEVWTQYVRHTYYTDDADGGDNATTLRDGNASTPLTPSALRLVWQPHDARLMHSAVGGAQWALLVVPDNRRAEVWRFYTAVTEYTCAVFRVLSGCTRTVRFLRPPPGSPASSSEGLPGDAVTDNRFVVVESAATHDGSLLAPPLWLGCQLALRLPSLTGPAGAARGSLVFAQRSAGTSPPSAGDPLDDPDNRVVRTLATTLDHLFGTYVLAAANDFGAPQDTGASASVIRGHPYACAPHCNVPGSAVNNAARVVAAAAAFAAERRALLAQQTLRPWSTPSGSNQSAFEHSRQPVYEAYTERLSPAVCAGHDGFQPDALLCAMRTLLQCCTALVGVSRTHFCELLGRALSPSSSSTESATDTGSADSKRPTAASPSPLSSLSVDAASVTHLVMRIIACPALRPAPPPVIVKMLPLIDTARAAYQALVAVAGHTRIAACGLLQQLLDHGEPQQHRDVLTRGRFLDRLATAASAVASSPTTTAATSRPQATWSGSAIATFHFEPPASQDEADRTRSPAMANSTYHAITSKPVPHRNGYAPHVIELRARNGGSAAVTRPDEPSLRPLLKVLEVVTAYLRSVYIAESATPKPSGKSSFILTAPTPAPPAVVIPNTELFTGALCDLLATYAAAHGYPAGNSRPETLLAYRTAWPNECALWPAAFQALELSCAVESNGHAREIVLSSPALAPSLSSPVGSAAIASASTWRVNLLRTAVVDALPHAFPHDLLPLVMSYFPSANTETVFGCIQQCWNARAVRVMDQQWRESQWVGHGQLTLDASGGDGVFAGTTTATRDSYFTALRNATAAVAESAPLPALTGLDSSTHRVHIVERRGAGADDETTGAPASVTYALDPFVRAALRCINRLCGAERLLPDDRSVIWGACSPSPGSSDTVHIAQLRDAAEQAREALVYVSEHVRTPLPAVTANGLGARYQFRPLIACVTDRMLERNGFDAATVDPCALLCRVFFAPSHPDLYSFDRAVAAIPRPDPRLRVVLPPAGDRRFPVPTHITGLDALLMTSAYSANAASEMLPLMRYLAAKGVPHRAHCDWLVRHVAPPLRGALAEWKRINRTAKANSVTPPPPAIAGPSAPQASPLFHLVNAYCLLFGEPPVSDARPPTADV